MIDESRLGSQIYGHLSLLDEIFTRLSTYILTQPTHTRVLRVKVYYCVSIFISGTICCVKKSEHKIEH